MAIFTLIVGIILVWTGFENTYAKLGSLLVEDMQGYVFWVIIILLVGSTGYIKSLKPLSVAFMTLIIISLILKNQNIFNVLKNASEGLSSMATNTIHGLQPLAPMEPMQ